MWRCKRETRMSQEHIRLGVVREETATVRRPHYRGREETAQDDRYEHTDDVRVLSLEAGRRGHVTLFLMEISVRSRTQRSAFGSAVVPPPSECRRIHQDESHAVLFETLQRKVCAQQFHARPRSRQRWEVLRQLSGRRERSATLTKQCTCLCASSLSCRSRTRHGRCRMCVYICLCRTVKPGQCDDDVCVL